MGRGPARTTCSGCSRSCCATARARSSCRDRLGIKPLYLAEAAARWIASTLPALLAAGGVDTRVDPVALHHYLSWHAVVPAPRTILRGVPKLPPATLRVIERDGAARDVRYWDPPFERRLDVEDWPGAVREALQRPSGAGWWPTCRSGSCSRAGSTRA